MNNYKIHSLILICAIALFPVLSCKKSEAPKDASAPVAYDKNAPAQEAMSTSDEAGVMKERKAVLERPDEGIRGITGHFLATMELAKDRLLEYRTDLTYESRDLMKSRRELLDIVSKYGFVKGSSISLEEKEPLAVSDVFVKSDKLYETLRELDRLGSLLSETITVTDHTEEMVLQERTVKREQIRIVRKNAAAGQVAPAARNWADIDGSLTQSEDRLDASEHAKWKIRDKVAWSWIHVTLKGPDQPDRIDVPRYADAFIGMINILLRLVYVVIYLLPVAAIVWLIVWKKSQIVAIFRRKKD
jgi:hypothetical protein